MPAIFSKNAIFSGLVDCYCLICAVKLTEESAVLHMIDSVHKENLRLFPYLDKYKSDCIRKIKKIYYCELCNLILTTATKVGFHVDGASHVNKKHTINKFNRLNSHIIYNNEIKINDDAWNGLIDESCVLCNIEFEDKEEHKHDMIHIIKLIQNEETIVYQPFARLYRKLDDNTFHCLTCNVVKSNQTLDDHFNSEAFHLENYQKSLYDYITTDTVKTDSECDQKGEKGVITEVPSNEKDISKNKVVVENEKKVLADLNDKIANKQTGLKQDVGKPTKKAEKVKREDDCNKTVLSDDNPSLVKIKISKENDLNRVKNKINLKQDESKLEEINNKKQGNVTLADKDTNHKTGSIKVADKDTKENQKNIKLAKKDLSKKPGDVQIDNKPLETVNPAVAVNTTDNKDDFKNPAEITDEEIFKILGVQSYVVRKAGQAFCMLCDAKVPPGHLTHPHHLEILKLHKRSKENNNSTVKLTDVTVKTEEIANASVNKQELKKEKGLNSSKVPPKNKDKQSKTQTKKEKELVVSETQHADEYIKSIAFFELFGIKQVAINDRYVIHFASFMCVTEIDEMHQKCEVCNSDYNIGHLILHIRSDEHIANVCSLFVLLKENEFIREVRPNILHCGYCNMVFEGSANLDVHLKSRVHYEQKTKALWLLAMYKKLEGSKGEMTMANVIKLF